MAELGASQRRAYGPSNLSQQGAILPPSFKGDSYGAQDISSNGHDLSSTIRSTYTVMSYLGDSDKGLSSSVRKIPRVVLNERPFIRRQVTFYKFLGWSGPTPVRWLASDFTPPQDGLTNITIEHKWVVDLQSSK